MGLPQNALIPDECEKPGNEAGVCIPGHTVSLANRPEYSGIMVPRVYMDTLPVKGLAYQRCVKDKHCAPIKKISLEEPLETRWENAHAFCTYSGKRLPTSPELSFAFKKNLIKPVEKEWTNDSYTDCVKYPGYCQANRMGICSGNLSCKGITEKYLSEVEKNTVRFVPVSFQKNESVTAFRCVTENYFDNAQPAWMLSSPAVEKPLPGPMTPEQKNLLHKLEALDTLDKPICKKKYTSPAHCKDPVSYIKPNESRNYLFLKYIKNLGGGYAGVAADANYSYIATARSRVAWLFDFDILINNLHRTLRAFIMESETVSSFLEKWNPKNRKSSLAILEKYYPDHPEFSYMLRILNNHGKELYTHYKTSARKVKTGSEFGWLRNADQYEYIRHMYLNDRIAIVPGDMLKDKSIRSIGNAAKKMGIPIRVYYPSNAEEFWVYNDNYRRNILNLPFDEASITFRTVHEYPWHPKKRSGLKGFWHYVVHGALNYQRKLELPHYTLMDTFKHHRVVGSKLADFSTIEIPSEIDRRLLLE